MEYQFYILLSKPIMGDNFFNVVNVSIPIQMVFDGTLCFRVPHISFFLRIAELHVVNTSLTIAYCILNVRSCQYNIQCLLHGGRLHYKTCKHVQRTCEHQGFLHMYRKSITTFDAYTSKEFCWGLTIAGVVLRQ